MDKVPHRTCDSPVQTHLHGHNENAWLVVLITFGLVVPMSVLTQLLTLLFGKHSVFLVRCQGWCCSGKLLVTDSE